MNKTTERIYLDYASATPLRAEARSAIEAYWLEEFANPQAVHTEGQRAHEAVESARARIAHALQVQASEIIFTSGATEANNLAIQGALRARQSTDDSCTVAINPIAHPSVTNFYNSNLTDAEITLLPIDESGRINIEDLQSQLSKDTAIVSIDHANSEIGTVQSVRSIAASLDELADSTTPLLHLDSSQTGLYYNLQPEGLGVDMLTLNAHKMYGPKGVGVLWVKSGTPLSSLFATDYERVVGDYQVLRPGTPPVSLIIGMAEVLVWAQKNYDSRAEAVGKVRDYGIDKLQAAFPDVQINGSIECRAPHNISLSFSEVDHDYLAARLDTAGVAVATTSACQARQEDSGSVVARLNTDADSAIRISLGAETSKEDIDKAVSILKRILDT